MSENKEKLLQIEGAIWKNNGEFATMDEVVAAKAAVKAMLPELSGSDHMSAIDLLDGLTRYNMFLEDGMFHYSTVGKRDMKSSNYAGKQKPS